MDQVRLEIVAEPKNEHLQKLRSALRQYNQQRVGRYTAKTFAVLAHRDDWTFVGGMYGWLQWGWLFVDLAWVDSAARGQGIGRKLLERFEAVAKEHNITRARLNTASFQGGLAFYKSCGYKVFVELDIDGPDGTKHVDYFLRKAF